MKRGNWADDPARIRAASWEGVISVHALIELGVPESTVYRRTQQDGPWTLILPATILLSNGEPTRRQLEIAALIYGGPAAMLTGIGGARHHGTLQGDDPKGVHLLVPIEQRLRSTGHVLVERTRRLPRGLVRDGLRVAPLARCLTDGTRRTKDLQQIASIFTEPVQRQLLLPEHLRQELDAGCRKGSAAPRRVLKAVDAHVWSAAEFDAREFWEAGGDLPPIAWNVQLYDESGRKLAVVDGFVEEVGFVWEIDSVAHHFSTPDQVEETLRRHRRLRGAGLHILSTRPVQVRDDPDGVRADVRSGLEIARLMPPPRVLLAPPAA